MLPQDPAVAFPSGKKYSPATSSTRLPGMTRGRRSARPRWRTITSACTTRRRWVWSWVA